MLGSNLSSSVATGGLEGALIGVAVLVLFIFRQFVTRGVTNWLNILAPLALLYFGMQGLGQLDPTGWLLLTVGLSLGIALGFARATTFHVWSGPGGQALMRGTALTLVLWVLTFAVKIGLTLGETSLGFGPVVTNPAVTFVPAAATLAAQVLVVYLRGQDLRFVGLNTHPSQ
jgi:hypothetical protein